jgi:hypothetical protein
MEEKKLVVTDDLKPILGVLKQEDAKAVLALKEELTDNWTKNQIFRTDTEMRISVLNDGKHPTKASKYWQSVREMSSMFDALMGLSFELRRKQLHRRKLEHHMEQALKIGDEFKVEELQIDLDENLYQLANMEQVAKDRVRELQSWSQIKSELDDGSFDTQNVNTHQAESYRLSLQNRVKTLTTNSSPSEIINAQGPLSTIERLSKEGKLLKFNK